MRNYFKIVLLMLFVSASASAQEMEKLSDGTLYKIFPANSGKKIASENVITVHVAQKTDKDSVLRSTYADGQPFKVQVSPTSGLGNLVDVFLRMSEKDSALVKIPTDSMYKGQYAAARPPFFPPGSSLVMTLKIERVQTVEEATEENNKLMEQARMREKSDLAIYIAKNKLPVKATGSGLMYYITRPSVKPKPMAGDTVYVNYIGKTIDGQVFDTSIEAEAKKAGLSQPGRVYQPINFALGEGSVIKGWDEGLALLNEGAKATLLVQSDLAYGPQGAGGRIPPFASLVFDIELVKVKKSKANAAKAKAPATTVRKPAAKPAAKPAVKPAAKPAVKKAPIKK